MEEIIEAIYDENSTRVFTDENIDALKWLEDIKNELLEKKK